MGLHIPGFRYFVLLVTFCCLTIITSNYVIINFTFICMNDGFVFNETDLDLVTNLTTAREFLSYTPSEKSTILSAVGVGTIVGTFPLNWLCVKYGAKYPFFAAGLVSAVATVLMPLAAESSWSGLLALRFVQGLSYAADFAAIGVVVVRWAPLDEGGIFIAVLTSFTKVASVITNTVSAGFCSSSLGWRWSFYAHAAFCVFIFLVWLVVYDDDPQNHAMVSPSELSHIQHNKTRAHIERDNFMPYAAICRHPTVLCIWLNAFAELVSITLLLTYAPIIYNKVLGFSVAMTGTVVSLSAIVNLPLKFVFAWLSDYIKCISELSKMRFFNSIALGCTGVFCCCLGFLSHPAASVTFFTLVFTCMGANCGGFYKCSTLVSRQYAHFVLACIQFTKCLSLFVGPGLVALFVHDESSLADWRPVYLTIGIGMFTANVFFVWMCSSEPADFTLITRESEEKRREEERSKEKQALEMETVKME